DGGSPRTGCTCRRSGRAARLLVRFEGPAVESHGQLVGKRAQAFAAVYVGQLIEQPGHDLSLGGRQRQGRSSRLATGGKPSPQTPGVLVTVERVAGPSPNRC